MGDQGGDFRVVAQEPFQAALEFRQALQGLRLQHFDREQGNQADDGTDTKWLLVAAGQAEDVIEKLVLLVPQADATRRFLSDRSRNRLEAGKLKVSSIFKWYGDDFARVGGVAAFLAGHAPALGLSDAQARTVREELEEFISITTGG